MELYISFTVVKRLRFFGVVLGRMFLKAEGGIILVGCGSMPAGEVSVKFKLPVDRTMYGLAVCFLAITVGLIVMGVVFWIWGIMSDVRSLLVVCVGLPIAFFVAFLVIVRIIISSYHELTSRQLIIFAPPFHVRVPLEEIFEIETDADKISTSFGKSMDVKYRETGEEGVEGGRVRGKFYGASVEHFGGETLVESVFSDKNLVLIKAKKHRITTNVPDVKEFVELVMGAVEKRKLSLKL